MRVGAGRRAGCPPQNNTERNRNMKFILRPYQQDIVERLRESYRAGFKAPLLASPVASGKTVMFAYITEAAMSLGNRVIILVHRQELLLQTSRALMEIGVPHGLIAPGFTQTTEPVQVASVQTLVRRLTRVPCPTFIIIDECHHIVAGSWCKIVHHYSTARLLGVTATPERLDGKGLGIKAGGFFDTLVMGPTVSDLIAQGYLSRPVVYAPPIALDLTGIGKRFGDFITSQVNDRVDKPTITGCAVEHYRKICSGVPAIAFCASVKHAEHVAEQFRAAGVPADTIDGNLPDTDRRRRIDDLASGRIKVLTSCEVISEGTDIPVVTAAILLRPTQSMGLYIQQVGRAMRIHPGKDRAVILDHVGNTFRHGFPDDDREWSLDGRERSARNSETGPEPYIQCGRCYLMFRRTDPCCPACGWVAPPAPRTIEQVEGELKEITEEEKRRMRMNQRNEVYQAQSLEALKAVAAARGYNPLWAEHVYRARQQKREASYA